MRGICAVPVTPASRLHKFFKENENIRNCVVSRLYVYNDLAIN